MICFDDDFPLFGPYEYQRLEGRFLHLIITRSDIAFVVQNLSQFMHSPKVSHTEAVIRVIKYVKQCPSLGILMSSNPSLD